MSRACAVQREMLKQNEELGIRLGSIDAAQKALKERLDEGNKMTLGAIEEAAEQATRQRLDAQTDSTSESHTSRSKMDPF